jgi:hypothetical protein
MRQIRQAAQSFEHPRGTTRQVSIPAATPLGADPLPGFPSSTSGAVPSHAAATAALACARARASIADNSGSTLGPRVCGWIEDASRRGEERIT